MHSVSTWLGVSRRKYDRMPHAESRVKSLWWYVCRSADDEPTSDTERVIQAYVTQCGRGRAIPVDFEADLRSCLQELSLPQRISPRRRRYWTIPAYALAHRIHTRTLCKRFRELEKIAKNLFPERVPQHRNHAPLTEEQKAAIRARFKEIRDFQAVASEFGIEAFRVGQLCRAEKAELIAQREQRLRAQEEKEASTFPLEEEETF